MTGRRQAGFSLLEVLVAFSVLALVLGVLLQIFSTGLRTAGLAQGYARATMLAESRLAAVGMEAPLEPGSSQGAFGDDGDYRWQMEVEPYVWREPELAETLPVIPYRVRLRVFWGEGDNTREIVLSTLKLESRP